MAAIIRFLKRTTGLPRVDEVLESLRSALESITLSQILGGSLLEGVVLTTGSIQKVSHKLDKPVTGYIVVKRNADCRVWDSETSNIEKRTFLYLNTSANVTVSLWVF